MRMVEAARTTVCWKRALVEILSRECESRKMALDLDSGISRVIRGTEEARVPLVLAVMGIEWVLVLLLLLRRMEFV